MAEDSVICTAVWAMGTCDHLATPQQQQDAPRDQSAAGREVWAMQSATPSNATLLYLLVLSPACVA